MGRAVCVFSGVTVFARSTFGTVRADVCHGCGWLLYIRVAYSCAAKTLHGGRRCGGGDGAALCAGGSCCSMSRVATGAAGCCILVRLTAVPPRQCMGVGSRVEETWRYCVRVAACCSMSWVGGCTVALVGGWVGAVWHCAFVAWLGADILIGVGTIADWAWHLGAAVVRVGSSSFCRWLCLCALAMIWLLLHVNNNLVQWLIILFVCALLRFGDPNMCVP